MTSRVGPKGQVVIPKALRDQVGIKPGDQVTFALADNAVLVEPVHGRPDLKGYLAGCGMLALLEAEHSTEVARGR
jgi:AbrB family looped-hinge helix DNA binding protein